MTQNIRDLSQNIHHHKTKEYFNEVLSSYEHGNYRSAVVMLYTVVICDLIFKLNDLRDVHNDEKAKQILIDLGTEREINPVSPSWENSLIEKAFGEAKLLENDIYTHITTLKKYRNLSGHPVLNSLEILYTPNEELTKSLIINVLDGLLNKHPLLTKNVFLPFVLEIERIKKDFSTEEKLESYLVSKFLNYFNEDLVKYMFKNLWKLVFKKDGEKEKENRDINFKVLLIIFKRNKGTLLELIATDSSYFSDFLDENRSILNNLIELLSRYPDIYPLLQQHSKELITERVKTKDNLKVKSYFLSDSIQEHLENLSRDFHSYGHYYNQPYTLGYKLSRKEIVFLEELSEKSNALSNFYDFVISHYYHSGNFDCAEWLFSDCITPYFSKFNKSQMETLLSKANSNEQCYKGRFSKTNHRTLLPVAKKVFGEDVEDKYENLF